jgi:uroporphyrinogen III methyltransferase/synthase
MTIKSDKPLDGKTIVITRAKHQAAEFSRLLTHLGARVIEFPTIEIVPPDSWEPVDRAIDNLRAYDWLIFTSANGVRSFVRRLRVRGKSIQQLEGIRFCAIGPRTAAEMKAEGIGPHLVPGEYRAESIVESLKKEGLAGKKILLARAKKARDVLPRELENLGARVDVVTAYQTIQPKVESSEFLALLKEGRIDAIAFTSSSTVSNFMEIFSPNRDELLRRLKNVAIAVIGPITRDRAVELGLPVQVCPAEYTVPALTNAMAEYLCCKG